MLEFAFILRTLTAETRQPWRSLKLTMYSYGDTDSIVISHTGLEDVSLVDSSEINSGFTPIDTITTATIINDRLALQEHLLLSVNQIYQL
jgi:hypothetical protein